MKKCLNRDILDEKNNLNSEQEYLQQAEKKKIDLNIAIRNF